MATETRTPRLPEPTLVACVLTPKRLVVPYWKKYVVSAPFGFTLPLSTAVVGWLFDTAPVVTTGFSAAAAVAGAHKSAPTITAILTPRIASPPDPLRVDGPPCQHARGRAGCGAALRVRAARGRARELQRHRPRPRVPDVHRHRPRRWRAARLPGRLRDADEHRPAALRRLPLAQEPHVPPRPRRRAARRPRRARARGRAGRALRGRDGRRGRQVRALRLARGARRSPGPRRVPELVRRPRPVAARRRRP